MRLRAAAIAAAVACGVAAAPAAAANFGSTDLTQPVTGGCAGYPCSVTDSVHADGGGETGSPIDGVLTSVRIRYAGDGAGGVVRVLRAADGGGFENVGPEIPLALPATTGDVVSVETRQPLHAGDRLALGADASFAGDSFLAEGSPRACLTAAEHPVGETVPYAACSGELPIQGTVEPDADGDAYGDDSQDGCPVDPVIHEGPCSADLGLTASVAPQSVTLFDPVAFTFSLANDGSSPAQDVGLKVPVGDSAQLLGATTTRGRCGGVRAVFCWLGTMAQGDTASVTVTLLPSAAGELAVRSTVSSATPDPNAGDNFTTPRASVVDPFAGVGLPAQRVEVRHGMARVLHSCPPVTARFCQGEALVARAAGTTAASGTPGTRGPRLGRARFQLQPAAAARIPIKLTAEARRLVAKRGRLPVVVTTKAVDGAGTRRTTYGRVTLVAPEAKSATGRGR